MVIFDQVKPFNIWLTKQKETRHADHILERWGELPPIGNEGVSFNAPPGGEYLQVNMLVGQ